MRGMALPALIWVIGATAGGLSAAEPILPLGLQREKPAEGRFVKTEFGYMVPYKANYPETDIWYEMVPIPPGIYQLGSPEKESGREPCEGPQIQIQIEPFWMAKFEITWLEYKHFMGLYAVFKEFEARRIRKVTTDNTIDAITVPTELYEPTFTFEKGDGDRQPAVTMTHYAAKQYTKWLTAISGRQYRMPGEAEWEYACRAGSATAYSFSADPSQLGEFAWFADNSDGRLHDVGGKKPNKWGLYDMHGSVAEWVADEFDENGYIHLIGKTKANNVTAILWPDVAFPRVVRGGHWGSMANECRSASRLQSDYDEWKDRDPNIPLSPWWTTSDPSRGVGFRLVRSLKPYDRELMKKFWEISDEDTQFDVDVRMEEGRGAVGLADPDLPKARREVE
jgi:formylglycine-generating enzyme required for sulfatase activity